MFRQLLAAHHNGMPGTELFGLLGELHARFAGKLFPHQIATIADDDNNSVYAGGANRVDDVPQHGPAANGHKHLGQVGSHPLAFARGEDDC